MMRSRISCFTALGLGLAVLEGWRVFGLGDVGGCLRLHGLRVGAGIVDSATRSCVCCASQEEGCIIFAPDKAS